MLNFKKLKPQSWSNDVIYPAVIVFFIPVIYKIIEAAYGVTELGAFEYIANSLRFIFTFALIVGLSFSVYKKVSMS